MRSASRKKDVLESTDTYVEVGVLADVNMVARLNVTILKVIKKYVKENNYDGI